MKIIKIDKFEESLLLNPYYRKIIKRSKEWFEKFKQFGNVSCFFVTLTCGHKQIYRHTGIIWNVVRCKKCEKLNIK